MFTGIVETIGIVTDLKKDKNNLIISVKSDISSDLKIDQSVCHNGVCLTVVQQNDGAHQVEAVEETLQKSNLEQLASGTMINLERALTLEQRLDGHLVQGHVDATGTCIERREQKGSTLFTFQFPDEFAALVIEKGSIAVNGVSLTAFDVGAERFSVVIIPYTLSHTMFQNLKKGEMVNLEFDIIGKYVLRSEKL